MMTVFIRIILELNTIWNFIQSLEVITIRMPVKDPIGQGDHRNEDAMNVEPNTNVNKAADSAHPPLQSPINHGHVICN